MKQPDIVPVVKTAKDMVLENSNLTSKIRGFLGGKTRKKKKNRRKYGLGK